MKEPSTSRIIVIGTSFGGLTALETLLPSLPEDFPVPIALVQHRSKDSDNGLRDFLSSYSRLSIVEPEDKQPIEPGRIYLAPQGYHLLVEPYHFALSIDAPVLYARPSINVLFETAPDTYRDGTIGVILTGANADGAQGLAKIKAYGGQVVVQDPASAAAPQMPEAALAATRADHILPLAEIGPLLISLCAEAKAPATNVT